MSLALLHHAPQPPPSHLLQTVRPRRSTPRYALEVACEVSAVSQGTARANLAWALDFSLNGARLETRSKSDVAEGDRALLKFSPAVGWNAAPLYLQTQVARVDDEQLGVSFMSLKTADQRRLAAWLRPRTQLQDGRLFDHDGAASRRQRPLPAGSPIMGMPQADVVSESVQHDALASEDVEKLTSSEHTRELLLAGPTLQLLAALESQRWATPPSPRDLQSAKLRFIAAPEDHDLYAVRGLPGVHPFARRRH